MKIITLDIKDLYVNLPTQGVINTAKFWLKNSPNTGNMNKQKNRH